MVAIFLSALKMIRCKFILIQIGKEVFFLRSHTSLLFLRSPHRWRCYDLFFLSLSLPERVPLWSRIIPVNVRERERGKMKEEEEKSPEKNHFALTGIWTHGLCLQSMLSIRPRRPAKELWYINSRLLIHPSKTWALCLNQISKSWVFYSLESIEYHLFSWYW